MTVIGIDVGGTKIAGAFVSQGGECSNMHITSTPAGKGAEAILSEIASVIRHLIEAVDEPPKAIGIGTAGQVDTERGIITHAVDTIPGWTGAPIADWLGQHFELPIFVDNDVNAMAVGEMRFGAGRGLTSAVYAAVGTGIGGALILDGKLWRGMNWSAGELGHVVVDWNGSRPCPCGQTGHLEGYASGPALAAEYCRRKRLPASNDLRRVMEAARQGDEIARAVLSEGAEILGKTLAGLINVFDPEALILGGGVIYGTDTLWWEMFERVFRSSAMPAPRKVQLRVAELRDHSVIVGAAALAWEKTSK